MQITQLSKLHRQYHYWYDKPIQVTFKVRKSSVVIFLLFIVILLLLVKPASALAPSDALPRSPFQKLVTIDLKPQKPMVAPVLAPQATLDPAPEPVVTVAAIVTPVIGNCGSDYYQQLVYTRESGCNTGAVNSIGCAGIGQACPGSKLPCSLSDWTCQNTFFTAYMLAVYGTWQAAWQHELNYNWW